MGVCKASDVTTCHANICPPKRNQGERPILDDTVCVQTDASDKEKLFMQPASSDGTGLHIFCNLSS